jgi:hypothetical protein
MKPFLALSIAITISLVLPGCNDLLPMAGKRATTSRPAEPAGAEDGAGSYSVTLGVTNRAGRLGALQFDVRTKGKGGWRGSGGSVACRNVSGAGMMACNNKGRGLLSCALVDEAGIATPTDLVVCKATSSGRLTVEDFDVKVVDATAPDVRPVKATVSVTKVVAD